MSISGDPNSATHYSHRNTTFPTSSVKQRAYRFDGLGNYHTKPWDLTDPPETHFNWYHVELPRGTHHLSAAAQYLIEILCPPLRLHDILNLVANGPYVAVLDGALVFRVNSPGPATSDFTIRLAARVTENSIVTVSLGRVPRLGFSPAGQSLLSEIPSVEGEKGGGGGGIVVPEHVLEFLLTMNHSEEGDNSVPMTVSNLLVHIVDTLVDQIQDIVTKMELELDSVELDLDKVLPPPISHTISLLDMGEAIDFSIDDLKSEDQSKVLHARRKKRSQKYLVSVEKRGICYLSRVPPHMDPGSLRQILSKHGEIQRIYLIPEDPTIQVKGKKVSGLRGKQFSEGWVEFTKKSIAKRVARMLNGEQIGGRRRSSFYYDIWNIKYLSKFKWEDMTNEIANKNHTREQKLAMELSAAKRERDFYMSKVDQSHALDSIKERFKKKQKMDGTASNGETATVFKSKFVRHFPQNKPVSNDSSTRKPHLSSDVLAGVFTATS